MALSKNCLMTEIDIESAENNLFKKSKNQEMATRNKIIYLLLIIHNL